VTELLASDERGIARAAELLRAGEVVAFPTETVYGLGADATRDSAVARIYEAKGRPAHNPLIVHVDGADAARGHAARWPQEADVLARRFWPGPLTMVVPAAAHLSRAALAGGDTVGLRAPDHPTALALLRACGLPLAAPSANRSGSLSPVRAEHVLDDLGGRIAAVLDGGACRVGIESTVVDLCGEEPVVLRPGMVERAALEGALGQRVLLAGERRAEGEPLRSPGLLDRHYAPRIPLRLKSRAEVESAAKDVARVFLPATPEEAARTLYEALWNAQHSGFREIWMEAAPATEEWTAVRDRLRRAAE